MKRTSASLIIQFSSVTQLCPTLCDRMNCSTPGLPVHHHLLEFIQTHVHRGGDAIQPSHPLSSPFPPAPSPSQHQSLLRDCPVSQNPNSCLYCFPHGQTTKRGGPISSVAQSCLTLYNPMNCSTPGFPAPHHFPEFAQIHVH